MRPEVVRRLREAGVRLADANLSRTECDKLYLRLAKANPAVAATEVGKAWVQVSGRVNLYGLYVRREIDALLDGDADKADAALLDQSVVTAAIHRHLPALDDAVDDALADE